MKFTKTRQNLQMTGDDPCFIDTSDYLWHYEPFESGSDLRQSEGGMLCRTPR